MGNVASSNNTKCLMNELAKLYVTLEEIYDDQSKLIKLLKSDADKFSIKQYNTEFPIRSVHELCDIEERCADIIFASKFLENIAHLKPRIPSDSWKNRALSELCTDEVLIEFNWDGSHDKHMFSELTQLNSVLFKAWQGDALPTYNHYVAFIKNQLNRIRGRVNKKRIRNRNSSINY